MRERRAGGQLKSHYFESATVAATTTAAPPRYIIQSVLRCLPADLTRYEGGREGELEGGGVAAAAAANDDTVRVWACAVRCCGHGAASAAVAVVVSDL